MTILASIWILVGLFCATHDYFDEEASPWVFVVNLVLTVPLLFIEGGAH